MTRSISSISSWSRRFAPWLASASATNGAAVPAAVATAAEEVDWTDPLDAEFTELESLLAAMATDAAFEITEL